jgi:hypothetical protein
MGSRRGIMTGGIWLSTRIIWHYSNRTFRSKLWKAPDKGSKGDLLRNVG